MKCQWSKNGYSTYINQRLSGFGGHVDRMFAKDLADLPDLRKKLGADFIRTVRGVGYCATPAS